MTTVDLVTSDDPQANPTSRALYGRLLVIHDALGIGAAEDLRADLGSLLSVVVEHVSQQATAAETWLLLVALTGSFPDQAEVTEVRRKLELLAPSEAVHWLLPAFQWSAMEWGSMRADLELVTDRVIVDVNYSARSTHLTGVQRVVRETARLWQNDYDVELVVWNDAGGAFRRLTRAENHRLGGISHVAPVGAGEKSADSKLVVPWGVPVILLEVPTLEHGAKLASMAEFSRSPIRMVGYDCIPAVSADLVPAAEPEKFGRYVEVVKLADRVAAISHSAAEEFHGLALALSAQGLSGPSLSACCLPTETELGVGPSDEVAQPGVPVILSVGSLGPRKNQVTIILAAEMLWREGLDFEVRLLGQRAGTGPVLDELLNRLKGAGRRLVTEKRASDTRVAETLAVAKCVIFPSLHEGFGLPVVEALSVGVPVVTSNHGSLQEIADGGGVVTVDAEDPTAVAAAMRRLLVDDDFHARLVAEAKSRPRRTWSDYANELWAVLGS